MRRTEPLGRLGLPETTPTVTLRPVLLLGLCSSLLSLPRPAAAQPALASFTVPVYALTARGTGDRLGSLRFSQSDKGLVVQANVRGLAPGPNSLHIHQYRSCAPAVEKGALMPGAAAGPHWDPTGVMGPGHGHGSHGSHGSHGEHGGGGALPLGDLPDLIANAEGVSTSVVSAPR
ncbi:MAG: hypothetical protein FJ050_12010, partial [Cyanobacteria bacterium M_surface_7_m2_040]|nr:hypothetical protein [Cyanobacteria bacterium M_surface_7_m2_040]